MVLWACSSNTEEFRRFLLQLGFSMVRRVSKVSRVMVGVRLSVKIRVSLVSVIG